MKIPLQILIAQREQLWGLSFGTKGKICNFPSSAKWEGFVMIFENKLEHPFPFDWFIDWL